MLLKWIQKIMVMAALAAFPLSLQAEMPSCYRQIEQNFFNPIFVSQALSLHFTIFQSSWSEISRKVRQNATQVPRIVRERAEKMHPNPHNVPIDYYESAKLLREVLLEVLTATLVEFQITNPNQINQIFDFVREKQQPQLDACFGKDVFR